VHSVELLVVGLLAADRRLDVPQFAGLTTYGDHDADVADDDHRHRQNELETHQTVVVRQVCRAASQVVKRTAHLSSVRFV